MSFGFAGAGAGAADKLQELLTTRHAEYLQQEQLKLQQAAAVRAAEQLALQKKESDADQVYRTGQVERQGRLDKSERAKTLVSLTKRGAELTPEIAGEIQGTEYAPTVETRQTLPSRNPLLGTSDAGGRDYSVFAGTPDQQQQDGQQQARARVVELFKRGAPRQEMLSAMVEAGQDPSAAMLEDPAAVRAAQTAAQGERDKTLHGYQMEEIGASGATQRALAAMRPAGGGQQLTPGQKLQYTRQFRNDFVRETAAAKTTQQQLALMKSSMDAVRRGALAPGSQGVLVTFQKILDPTSVVRESEYARSASGLSLIARLEGQWQTIASGGAGVPAEELEKFVALAEQFAANAAQAAADTKAQIDAIADENGLDKNQITRDFSAQPPPVGGPSLGGSPGAAERAGPTATPTSTFRVIGRR